MAFIDYYKILEINKTASVEDIKKAYRKLARKLLGDLYVTFNVKLPTQLTEKQRALFEELQKEVS